MSFVPGSEPRDLWFVLGGTAAMVVGLLWMSSSSDRSVGRVVVRCTDGSRIGEWGTGVRRRPAGARGLRSRFGAWRQWFHPRLREDLEPGDLTDLRVREGREAESAWVVEGLDRGAVPFRIHWEFGSADSALLAFRLLEQRIVRPPLDPEGRPLRLTDREFEEWWEVGASAGPSSSVFANGHS